MPGHYLFHHAILCGFYSRAATIRERRLLNSGRKMKKSTGSRKVEWLQTPRSQSEETMPRLPLQRILSSRNQTSFADVEEDEAWWIGGEGTCSRRLLIHYTMLSTIIKLQLMHAFCLFWYCHRVTNTCARATRILATAPALPFWRFGIPTYTYADCRPSYTNYIAFTLHTRYSFFNLRNRLHYITLDYVEQFFYYQEC